jgi:hypothetical protein
MLTFQPVSRFAFMFSTQRINDLLTSRQRRNSSVRREFVRTVAEQKKNACLLTGNRALLPA